jgi:hypothetical protein
LITLHKTEEARELLDSINIETVVGLRDRSPEALIAYVRQQNQRGDSRHPMRR